MSRVSVSGTAALIVAASLFVQAQPQRPAPPPPRPTLNGSARSVRVDPFTATIQGTTLDSVSRPLASAVVRLRDARHGQILDTQVSDASGAFTFRGVEPGSYIVELVGSDRQTVVAASELININAGEVVSTIVKLPLRVPSAAGLLGHSPATAAIVMSAAAAAGVLATAVTGAAASPQR
jgi:hypothetical protein